MLARVVTLRFDPRLEAFDDGPLQEVLKSREVFAIRDHFFVREGVPYLAVLITYGPQPRNAEPVAEKARAKDGSWRAVVSDEDLPLFNALRDWRAERAKRDGVPPYLICTNRQLAEMVRARPESMNRLGAIDGIGKAKLENYGQDLLALLARPAAGDGIPDTTAAASGGRPSGGQQSAPPSPDGIKDC